MYKPITNIGVIKKIITYINYLLKPKRSDIYFPAVNIMKVHSFTTQYISSDTVAYRPVARQRPRKLKVCEENTKRLVGNGRQPGSCQLRAQLCTGGCEDRTRAREAEESPL
jgi:hypothetical protein